MVKQRVVSSVEERVVGGEGLRPGTQSPVWRIELECFTASMFLAESSITLSTLPSFFPQVEIELQLLTAVRNTTRRCGTLETVEDCAPADSKKSAYLYEVSARKTDLCDLFKSVFRFGWLTFA